MTWAATTGSSVTKGHIRKKSNGIIDELVDLVWSPNLNRSGGRTLTEAEGKIVLDVQSWRKR